LTNEVQYVNNPLALIMGSGVVDRLGCLAYENNVYSVKWTRRDQLCG